MRLRDKVNIIADGSPASHLLSQYKQFRAVDALGLAAMFCLQ